MNAITFILNLVIFGGVAQCLKLYIEDTVVEVDALVDKTSEIQGDTLFLTPLIEGGEIDLAQNLSRVTELPTRLENSHTGYITVNKQDGGHMFFWYFPSQVRLLL